MIATMDSPDIRQLICNCSGIVIGETIYRCIKCLDVFEASRDLCQHYNDVHMTEDDGDGQDGHDPLDEMDQDGGHINHSPAHRPQNNDRSSNSGNNNHSHQLNPNAKKMRSHHHNDDEHENLDASGSSSSASMLQSLASQAQLQRKKQLQQMRSNALQSDNNTVMPSNSGGNSTLVFSVPAGLPQLQKHSQSQSSSPSSSPNPSQPNSRTLKSLLTAPKNSLLTNGGLFGGNGSSNQNILEDALKLQVPRSKAELAIRAAINNSFGMSTESNGPIVKNSSTPNSNSSTGTGSQVRGGYVTCEVCGMTKYYSSHLSRRFGVFSCEACAKFFRRYLIRPKKFFCERNNNCDLKVATPGGRCKSCLLKACMAKYVVDMKRYPKIIERRDPSYNAQLAEAKTPSQSSSAKQSKPKAVKQEPPEDVTMASTASDEPSNSQSSQIVTPPKPQLGAFMKRDEFLKKGALAAVEPDEEEEEDEDEDDMGGDDAEEEEEGSPLDSQDSQFAGDGDEDGEENMTVEPQVFFDDESQDNEGDGEQDGDGGEEQQSEGGSANEGQEEEEGDELDEGEDFQASGDIEEVIDEDGELHFSGADDEEQENFEQAPDSNEDEGSPEAPEEVDFQQPKKPKKKATEQLVVTPNQNLNGFRITTRRSSQSSQSSGKSPVKSPGKSSQKITKKRDSESSGALRNRGCKTCSGCTADDCGSCVYCLDKPKFGGPGFKKQKCVQRKCLNKEK